MPIDQQADLHLIDGISFYEQWSAGVIDTVMTGFAADNVYVGLWHSNYATANGSEALKSMTRRQPVVLYAFNGSELVSRDSSKKSEREVVSFGFFLGASEGRQVYLSQTYDTAEEMTLAANNSIVMRLFDKLRIVMAPISANGLTVIDFKDTAYQVNRQIYPRWSSRQRVTEQAEFILWYIEYNFEVDRAILRC